MTRQSDIFRENANNCVQLAEIARNDAAFLRDHPPNSSAWRALADEQDWLDGEVSPVSMSEYKSAKAGSSGSLLGYGSAVLRRRSLGHIAAFRAQGCEVSASLFSHIGIGPLRKGGYLLFQASEEFCLELSHLR